MTRRRGERGAAALEGGLVLPFVLLPLLFGILYYGNVIWRMQPAQGTAARLPLSGITGDLTCLELVERVKSTALAALPALDASLAGTIGLEDIVVTVVKPIPTVGVVLDISISAPVAGSVVSLLPLPGVSDVVSEATYRLDGVRVTTQVCS